MVTPQDGHRTQSQRRRVAVREAGCLLVKLHLNFRQFFHELDEKQCHSTSSQTIPFFGYSILTLRRYFLR